tara:strand:- start:1243 stop:2100 length:858 start_codon:yes stop_codon:yes gene_type:complete
MTKKNKDMFFFKEKKIKEKKILSKSFGMVCEKIVLEDENEFISKSYLKQISSFNAITSEAKSINYMKKKFPKLFPKIYYFDNKTLIMEYIKNDGEKGKDFEKELAINIASIHKIKNNKYGFDFDTPIGGLKQPNKYSGNWVDFYKENRLGMVFKEINNENPMPHKLNRGIEKILNDLENLIPKNPPASLIHGDLWDGNILFEKGKLKGLIDPGIHFAHNEMEIAYLSWFKYITKKFYVHYSNIINLDNNYKKYEKIYQLYYCLLNVHLWSREYITNASEIVEQYV